MWLFWQHFISPRPHVVWTILILRCIRLLTCEYFGACMAQHITTDSLIVNWPQSLANLWAALSFCVAVMVVRARQEFTRNVRQKAASENLKIGRNLLCVQSSLLLPSWDSAMARFCNNVPRAPSRQMTLNERLFRGKFTWKKKHLLFLAVLLCVWRSPWPTSNAFKRWRSLAIHVVLVLNVGRIHPKWRAAECSSHCDSSDVRQGRRRTAWSVSLSPVDPLKFLPVSGSVGISDCFDPLSSLRLN